MKFAPIEIKDKIGRTVVLRSAEVSDGDAMLDYLKITASETRYLSREPEEITLTSEQQASFIQSRINSENELMLIALINGKHIGNCALAKLGGVQRYAHRCSVSIALYKEYCGFGIGEAMMKSVWRSQGISDTNRQSLRSYPATKRRYPSTKSWDSPSTADFPTI